METVPTLFNKLYPFMPMTYSVNLFKEVISGNTGNFGWQNVGILLGILAAFTGLNILFAVMKRAKAKIAEKVIVHAEI